MDTQTIQQTSIHALCPGEGLKIHLFSFFLGGKELVWFPDILSHHGTRAGVSGGRRRKKEQTSGAVPRLLLLSLLMLSVTQHTCLGDRWGAGPGTRQPDAPQTLCPALRRVLVPLWEKPGPQPSHQALNPQAGGQL